MSLTGKREKIKPLVKATGSSTVVCKSMGSCREHGGTAEGSERMRRKRNPLCAVEGTESKGPHSFRCGATHSLSANVPGQKLPRGKDFITLLLPS